MQQFNYVFQEKIIELIYYVKTVKAISNENTLHNFQDVNKSTKILLILSWLFLSINTPLGNDSNLSTYSVYIININKSNYTIVQKYYKYECIQKKTSHDK